MPYPIRLPSNPADIDDDIGRCPGVSDVIFVKRCLHLNDAAGSVKRRWIRRKLKTTGDGRWRDIPRHNEVLAYIQCVGVSRGLRHTTVIEVESESAIACRADCHRPDILDDICMNRRAEGCGSVVLGTKVDIFHSECAGAGRGEGIGKAKCHVKSRRVGIQLLVQEGNRF